MISRTLSPKRKQKERKEMISLRSLFLSRSKSFLRCFGCSDTIIFSIAFCISSH